MIIYYLFLWIKMYFCVIIFILGKVYYCIEKKFVWKNVNFYVLNNDICKYVMYDV